MIKSIGLSLIGLIAILLISSCGVEQEVEASSESLFKYVSTEGYGGGQIEIMYDKETKVMYAVGFRESVLPLYEADGSLKLYKE